MIAQTNTMPVVGLLRLMRPKQWIKNTFVLAPLVFAREFTHPESVINALIAFGLFCVASSATYILNDIRDVERDRTHPIKRHSRPLAAGTVSLRSAIGREKRLVGWLRSRSTSLRSFRM